MRKKPIFYLLFLNFITMASFNMAHPVTPRLIQVLNLPTYMFGVFFSFMAIANFVAAPIWGGLSDQKGRKPFLILGVIGYGLGQLGFGLIPHVVPILFFRLVSGALSVCFITVAIAAMTDLTEPKDRIRYLAYHTASASIGASMGALLGGWIGQNDYKMTFIAQFIATLIIAAIIMLLFKETMPKKEGIVKIYLQHLKPSRTFMDLQSELGIMIIVMILITITTTSYNSSITYYVETILQLPTTINGVVMAASGIIALFMNLIINPFLSRLISPYQIIKGTTLITGCAILLASLMDSLGLAMIFLSIFIASSALIIPIHQSIVTRLAKDQYGEVMGLQNSAKALGMIIGSLTAGFIFNFNSRAPFILSGICALGVWSIMSIKFPKR